VKKSNCGHFSKELKVKKKWKNGKRDEWDVEKLKEFSEIQGGVWRQQIT
jgi:hypothetical protein